MHATQVFDALDCTESCQQFRKMFTEEQERLSQAKTSLLSKIKDLETKVQRGGALLRELKEHQEQLEKELKQEDTTVTILKSDVRTLKEKHRKIVNEREALRSEVEMAKNYQPSAQDTAALQKCRVKYQLYKYTSGIRWDYMSKTPHGYVTNKKTLYAKPFSLKDTSEDDMWEEISKASNADWSAFACGKK